jgi:hypothetical protein
MSYSAINRKLKNALNFLELEQTHYKEDSALNLWNDLIEIKVIVLIQICAFKVSEISAFPAFKQ